MSHGKHGNHGKERFAFSWNNNVHELTNNYLLIGGMLICAIQVLLLTGKICSDDKARDRYSRLLDRHNSL